MDITEQERQANIDRQLALATRIWTEFRALPLSHSLTVEDVEYDEDSNYGMGLWDDLDGWELCYLASRGSVESVVSPPSPCRAPRFSIGFHVIGEEGVPLDDDNLVSRASSALAAALNASLDLLATMARERGETLGPDNTKLVFFGSMLSKAWVDDEWPNDEHFVGRVALALSARFQIAGEHG